MSETYPRILPLTDQYVTRYMGLLYITFHFFVRNKGYNMDKAIFDSLYLSQSFHPSWNDPYLHIKYCLGHLHLICLQDTTSLQSLVCPHCLAILLPLPLQPLLLTPWSGFSG